MAGRVQARCGVAADDNLTGDEENVRMWTPAFGDVRGNQVGRASNT